MHTPSPSKIKIRVASWLFCLLIFLLTFNLSMHSDLNHDEHQFIASAALLANDGLLPYVDYPYFHMPYLVFIYAGLFLFSPYFFWSTHLFSMLCSWLTLILIFAIGLRLFEQYKPTVYFGMAASGALLLLANPLFTHTSGRSWNHDLPILLTVLAFICHTKYLALRNAKANKWLLLSGLLIGLATGVRLTFAVLVVPFAIVIYLLPTDFSYASKPKPHRHLGKALLFFGSGIFLALLPAFVLFLMAPEQFFFGNFTYPELNRRYYDEIRGEGKQITIGSKLLYLAMLIVEQPSNLLLLLLFLATLLQERKRLKELLTFFRAPEALLTRRDSDFSYPISPDLLLLLLMQPFLLLGAFAPSPSQKQYFFVMVPFLLLAQLYLLAESSHFFSRSPWRFRFFTLITLTTCLLAIPQYITLWHLFFPSKWYPMKIERDAKRLASLTQGGYVLTLAPILPLEGELDIYPAFATGPFALRIAPLVRLSQRKKYALVSEDELFPFLAASPPRAILVGLADDDKPAEATLVAYAREHDYVPWELPDDSVVWFSPLIEWGGKIRLGTYTLPSEPLALSPSHGEPLITLYLQAMAPIEQNFNMLLRLVGRDGNEIWRDEGWPYGSPTSTWQEGQVWPDGHEILLPTDLSAGYYRLELSFYNPETFEALPAQKSQTGEPLGDVVALDYLAVGDLPTSPHKPLNPPAQIGSAIRLLGHEILEETQKSDGEQRLLRLRLFWQPQAELSTNYTVFVHLVAPDRQLITQQDQQPLGGFFPTSAWRPFHRSQVIADEYQLILPADTPPAPGELRVGMYDAATGQRLPIMQDGQAISDYVPIAIP